jgi:hypothetical protein
LIHSRVGACLLLWPCRRAVSAKRNNSSRLAPLEGGGDTIPIYPTTPNGQLCSEKGAPRTGLTNIPGNPGHRELLGEFLTGGHGKLKPWQNRVEFQIENTSPIQVKRCFAQQDKTSHQRYLKKGVNIKQLAGTACRTASISKAKNKISCSQYLCRVAFRVRDRGANSIERSQISG